MARFAMPYSDAIDAMRELTDAIRSQGGDVLARPRCINPEARSSDRRFVVDLTLSPAEASRIARAMGARRGV